MIDCHVHCKFSADSTMEILEGCVRTQQRGLAGITLTDHIEFDCPNPAFTFIFDPEEREKAIEQVQQKIDSTLKILKGIELGFQPHLLEKMSLMIASHVWDFVILSTHIVDGYDLCRPYFLQHTTKELAYTRYLETVLASVTSFKNYDVVGHLGYICRYAPYKDRSMRLADYPIIEKILTTVIADGKGFELNTSGLRTDLGHTLPTIEILKRYKELGGDFVTLGSDAHAAKNVGQDLKKGSKLLKELGFTTIYHFENRRPVATQI